MIKSVRTTRPAPRQRRSSDGPVAHRRTPGHVPISGVRRSGSGGCAPEVAPSSAPRPGATLCNRGARTVTRAPLPCTEIRPNDSPGSVSRPNATRHRLPPRAAGNRAPTREGPRRHARRRRPDGTGRHRETARSRHRDVRQDGIRTRRISTGMRHTRAEVGSEARGRLGGRREERTPRRRASEERTPRRKRKRKGTDQRTGTDRPTAPGRPTDAGRPTATAGGQVRDRRSGQADERRQLRGRPGPAEAHGPADGDGQRRGTVTRTLPAEPLWSHHCAPSFPSNPARGDCVYDDQGAAHGGRSHTP